MTLRQLLSLNPTELKIQESSFNGTLSTNNEVYDIKVDGPALSTMLRNIGKSSPNTSVTLHELLKAIHPQQTVTIIHKGFTITTEAGSVTNVNSAVKSMRITTSCSTIIIDTYDEVEQLFD